MIFGSTLKKIIGPHTKILLFRLVILLLCAVFSLAANAQQSVMDSLVQRLKSAQSDPERLAIYIQLCEHCEVEQNLQYAQPTLDLINKMLLTAKEGDEKNALIRARAESYNYFTFYYDYIADEAKKIHYLESSIQDFRSIGDTDGTFKSYMRIAQANFDIGNTPACIEYYQKSIAFAKEMRSNKLAAYGQLMMGFMFLQKKEFEIAIDYFQKSGETAKSFQDTSAWAWAIRQIGVAYSGLKDTVQAMTSFRQALSLYGPDNSKRAETYQEIGDAYKFVADYPQAIRYYQMSMALDSTTSFRNLNRIGNTFRDAGQFDSALIYINKSCLLAEKSEGTEQMMWSRYSLVKIYMAKSEFQKAKSIFDPLYDIAQKKSPRDIMSDVEHTAYLLDSALGNHRSALQHYIRYVGWIDKYKSDDLKRQAAEDQFQEKADRQKAQQEVKDALAANELKRQQGIRNVLLIGLTIVLLFAMIIFRQRNKIAKEKKRSDRLLLNILPSETAEELKTTGFARTKYFEHVTVMFTDFKNFTRLAETLSPEELVKEIHYCYSAFDSIITAYGLEKIKTIGDAYMCAGGLPVVTNSHAEDTIKAALAIREFMAQEKKVREEAGQPFFEIRIGIHSGPVVAGVVGTHKFSYDIWGDAVNTAARMESSGEAGRINVSQSTYESVQDKFNFEYRGKVLAKNKGEIDMYFVDSIKA